jgi:hypothetical protein
MAWTSTDVNFIHPLGSSSIRNGNNTIMFYGGIVDGAFVDEMAVLNLEFKNVTRLPMSTFRPNGSHTPMTQRQGTTMSMIALEGGMAIAFFGMISIILHSLL